MNNPPPIDNRFVEPGCEQFSSKPPASIADELATLRAQLESKDKLIKDFCHTENEVEKSALKVLTDLQVHGDSFGVPGTNQIVDTLVSEVQSLRTRLAEVEAQLQEAVRLLVRHLPPTRKEKSCE